MFGLIALIFGLVIGSFTNAAAPRWIERESMMTRSHCHDCGHEIAWYDNIPLLSFLFLKGKCRYCHSAISWRYPFIELLMGLFFFAIYQMYGATFLAVKIAFFAWAFVLATMTDVEYREIPDEVAIAAVIFAVIGATGGYINLIDIAFGVLPSVFLFFLSWGLEAATGKEMIGVGDLKFLFGVGAVGGMILSSFILFGGFVVASFVFGAFFVEDLWSGNRTYVPLMVGFCGAFLMAFLLGWLPILMTVTP